jgi:AcrR family transcriptional regulator
MNDSLGLRERKKRQTRHRLADVAARLFAQHGFDAVSVSDVARAADVSEQTVYNYFPSKPDLVLDRDEEIRERLGEVVRARPSGTTPADALLVVAREDIERFVQADAAIAKGEFPAQCLESPMLRRFALESRARQAETIAAAILETNPDANDLIVRAHAAALVSVVQSVTDRIGRAILDDAESRGVARALWRDALLAFRNLGDHFDATIGAPRQTS